MPQRWSMDRFELEQKASEVIDKWEEEEHISLRDGYRQTLERLIADALTPALLKCKCGAVGFSPSKLPGQCEFCDGTFGGNPPE